MQQAGAIENASELTAAVGSITAFENCLRAWKADPQRNFLQYQATSAATTPTSSATETTGQARTLFALQLVTTTDKLLYGTAEPCRRDRSRVAARPGHDPSQKGVL